MLIRSLNLLISWKYIKMDFSSSGIEVFLEEDFEENQEGVHIQGVFKNLVEDIPGDINDFHLGFEEDLEDDIVDFEEDFEEIEIDVDPVNFNNEDDSDSAFSEDDFDDDDNDSLVSWCGESSVCSFNDLGYDGWLSSEDEDQMEEAVLGYQIDFNGINHNDTIWEDFIITSRANYLLGNYTNEWYFFYLQQLNHRLFDIRRGFTPEDTPQQQLQLQEE